MTDQLGVYKDYLTESGQKIFKRALAEFERDRIRERTKAGLKAARARGVSNGRPLKLTRVQIQIARTLMKNPANKSADICNILKVSRPTLYRYCLDKGKKTVNKSD
jgi:DNA invertase Pin-like site-specific DNA recombinase